MEFYVCSKMYGEQLIRISHEKLGHLAVEKCVSDLTRTYWFPAMRSKVTQFIRNCLPCILHSMPKTIQTRTLHCIPKSCRLLHTIHIDHQGLPSIKSIRKHLLVVIDSFTKFVNLFQHARS